MSKWYSTTQTNIYLQLQKKCNFSRKGPPPPFRRTNLRILTIRKKQITLRKQTSKWGITNTFFLSLFWGHRFVNHDFVFYMSLVKKKRYDLHRARRNSELWIYGWLLPAQKSLQARSLDLKLSTSLPSSKEPYSQCKDKNSRRGRIFLEERKQHWKTIY